MAHVVVEGSILRVKMSRWERLGALHRDLAIDISRVESFSVSTSPWQLLEGVRAPGTGLPGVMMIGTMRAKGTKTFCAIYRHTPAIVIITSDPEFGRIIVSSSDADQVAAALAVQLHPS